MLVISVEEPSEEDFESESEEEKYKMNKKVQVKEKIIRSVDDSLKYRQTVWTQTQGENQSFLSCKRIYCSVSVSWIVKLLKIYVSNV